MNCRAALLLVLLCACATTPPRETVSVTRLPPLALGLTGHTGEEKGRQDAQELSAFFTARLGREVSTRFFESYDELAEALAQGALDLGWMHPYALVKAQDLAAAQGFVGGVVPLAKAVRDGLPFYRSVLFARKGFPTARGLRELAGRSVAWGNSASTAGYLFPRALLREAGLDPAALFAREENLDGHAAVCRAVYEGRVDVGATFANDRPGGAEIPDGCLQALGEKKTIDELAVLAISAPIPNDVVATRPGLPADEAGRVRALLLGMGSEPGGRALLGRVFKAEGFVEIGGDDFVPVRQALEAERR